MVKCFSSNTLSNLEKCHDGWTLCSFNCNNYFSNKGKCLNQTKTLNIRLDEDQDAQKIYNQRCKLKINLGNIIRGAIGGNIENCDLKDPVCKNRRQIFNEYNQNFILKAEEQLQYVCAGNNIDDAKKRAAEIYDQILDGDVKTHKGFENVNKEIKDRIINDIIIRNYNTATSYTCSCGLFVDFLTKEGTLSKINDYRIYCQQTYPECQFSGSVPCSKSIYVNFANSGNGWLELITFGTIIPNRVQMIYEGFNIDLFYYQEWKKWVSGTYGISFETGKPVDIYITQNGELYYTRVEWLKKKDATLCLALNQVFNPESTDFMVHFSNSNEYWFEVTFKGWDKATSVKIILNRSTINFQKKSEWSKWIAQGRILNGSKVIVVVEMNRKIYGKTVSWGNESSATLLPDFIVPTPGPLLEVKAVFANSNEHWFEITFDEWDKATSVNIISNQLTFNFQKKNEWAKWISQGAIFYGAKVIVNVELYGKKYGNVVTWGDKSVTLFLDFIAPSPVPIKEIKASFANSNEGWLELVFNEFSMASKVQMKYKGRIVDLEKKLDWGKWVAGSGGKFDIGGDVEVLVVLNGKTYKSMVKWMKDKSAILK